MTQLTIDDAIAQGETAMQACTRKAEGLGFNTESARSFVLNFLNEFGPSWGEDMVTAAEGVGRSDLTVHDARAWGAVFSSLSRRGRIRCVEIGMRTKGNGTAGARKWAIVQ